MSTDLIRAASPPVAGIQVVFRLDASPLLGSGHLVRCQALADALRGPGARSLFLLGQPVPPVAAAALEAAGHAWQLLSPVDAPEPAAVQAWSEARQQADASRCLAALGGRQPAWLVVDHYGLGAPWQAAMAPAGARVLAIDDLANRPQQADLLLDQNHYEAAAARYAPWVPATTQLLLGPRHALLRAGFARAPDAPARAHGSGREVLVCFGGGAPGDIVESVVAALALRPAWSLTVIAPAAQRARLQALAAPGQGLRLLAFCEDMPALMRQADLAIGAGGGMLWERFSLGLPGLVFGLADNQVPGLQSLLGAGLVGGHADARQLDAAAVQALVLAALDDTAPLQQSADRAARLVDGHGARRVATRMCMEALHLRPAHAEDAEPAWHWRNAPSTRAVSTDPAELPLATHLAWWQGSLGRADRRLWMAALGDAAVGVLRVDIAGVDATVSIYCDPAMTGLGLGPRMLAALVSRVRQELPEVRRLLAVIRPDNLASRRAFASVGFIEDGPQWALSLGA